MPKCIECGTVAKRLQWTHFFYKCTGKFKNGKEYKIAYPHAKLVDDEFAKSTACTLVNMQKKYGTVQGQAAWDDYKRKQAYSNTLQYKQEKHGWIEADFDEYNKSRAVTLKNLIERHGEVTGAIKWQSYCDRQAYTNTKEYFIEKFGTTTGTDMYNEVCRIKSHSLDVVMERNNCDEAVALDIIANYKQSEKYSSNLEKQFADEIMSALEEELRYYYKTKQYCIWANDKPNFYDIVHNDKAIEFNGDYWHCNPNKYAENWYHPQSELLARHVWEKDAKKIQALKDKRNIDTLIIWESEYLADPKTIIQRCITWLK